MCSVASFNCRCFTDIAAISEQCGVSRLVVAAVLPMVDSATDVHLSLAVVLVFISEMESDPAARNIARYGSFTSKSVLYRKCLGIRAFSIQPQTLNNCLRSSFATSNRWSLWSSVPEYDRESVNSLLCVCRQITKSITLYIGLTRCYVTALSLPCCFVSSGMLECRIAGEWAVHFEQIGQCHYVSSAS